MQVENLTPEDGTVPAQEEPQNPEQPVTEPTAPQQPEPEKPDETETVEFWKNKATEQAAENIVLNGKLKDIQPRRETILDPTDEEVRARFPSTFDYMTDTEKALARGQVIADHKADAAMQKQSEREEQERWTNAIESAIIANHRLEGRERAFREFASKPSHRGAPVSVLVDAFLHKHGTSAQPKRDPQPGLEPGSGGPREPEKPKTLSGEDLAKLRRDDHKAYREYVRTHDVDI